MYHYLNTPLEQQDYIKNLTFCDTLCAEKNIDLYWWNINDRIFIPEKEKVNGFYKPLTTTTFADIDAISFLEKNGYKNMDKKVLDGEHYNEYVHEKIAELYIPHLKSLKETHG